MGKGSPLHDVEREFVLRLIAEYGSNTEICRLVQSEFGRSIASSLVSYYRRSEIHAERRAQYRAELKSTILERIPVASKFYRLQQIQKLIDEAKWRIVRYADGVDKAGHLRKMPIYEKQVGEVRALLQLAAQEMGDLKDVVEHIGSTQDRFVAEFDDGSTYQDADPSEAAIVPEEIVN